MMLNPSFQWEKYSFSLDWQVYVTYSISPQKLKNRENKTIKKKQEEDKNQNESTK